MKNRLLLIALSLVLCGVSQSAFAQGYFNVTNPLTDNMVTPLGLDEVPVFGWDIESNIVGEGQSAYRIVIKDKAGNAVWDTGKVPSSKSSNVELDYSKASNLKNGTDYFWTVTVWDKKGKPHNAPEARFSTGLAYELCTYNDKDFDNVKDAVFGREAMFIGSPDITLDAASLTVYNISYDIKLDPGTTKAGFIYAGGEMRMSNAMYNDYLIEGETYISVVYDITPLVEGKGPAQMKIYRKGYSPIDNERPGNTSLLKAYDLDNITKDNMYDKHSVFLSCTGGNLINCTLDGTAFQKPDAPATNQMGYGGGAPAGAPAGFGRGNSQPQLFTNPLGRGGDSCKYPHLGQIGFCAEGSAQFSGVKVNYINKPASTVFGENIGATYAIFKDLPGITVNGGTINVKNTLAYADPSFGSEPMVRTTFTTTGKVADAKLYVTSRGVNEFFMNGKRVEAGRVYTKDGEGRDHSRDFLSPGMLQFYGTMRYVTYDVTDRIVSNGKNAMGAVMGPGWWGDEYVYNPSYFNWYGEKWGVMAKLVITYDDGRTQEIVTNDRDWKSFLGGPITYSSLYHGEFYDARKEKAIEGWSTASYDDSAWKKAAFTPAADANFENPDYEGRIDYPIHVVQVLPGKHIHTPSLKYRDNPEHISYIFDMGENMVGVPEIRFRTTLPEGTEVVLRYGETRVKRDFLYPFNAAQMDGMIYTENYRGARSIDRYIAKGTPGGETFIPTLTFHGWRFIDVSINGNVSKAQQQALLASLEVNGLVLSSLTDITTTFESSNPLLDRFFLNVARSHYGNHVSVGTDCPQRNERLPFLGDQQIYSETSVYMADMTQFYSNYAQLGRDVQLNSASRDYQSSMTGRGAYYSKEGVPQNPDGKTSNVAWPMGGLTMIWDIYANNGDLSALRESWDSFVMYTQQFINAGKQDPKYNYLFQGGGLSNHLEMSKSSNSGYDQICEFGRTLMYMATMADALGKKNEADYYRDYFLKLKDEFNDNMISDQDVPLDYNGNPTTAQSSYAIAIYYDMIDYAKHPNFVKNYLERCQFEGTELTATVNNIDMPLHEWSVTSGFTGTPCILGALGKNGEFGAAYKMLENEKFSSWLYPVTIGATSLWERWNTETEYGPINQSMNSWNHYGFGVAAAFMITQVGGIQRGDNGIYDSVGFSDFVLQPVPGGSLDHAKVAYKSSNGLIESAWTAEPGKEDAHGVSALNSYSATVPANTSATLYLPVSGKFSAQAAKKVKTCAGVTYRGLSVRNGIPVMVFRLQSGGFDFTSDGSRITVSLKSGYTTR